MSRSRSDGVAQFVCSSVCPFVKREFFFNQKSFNSAQRRYKGCLNEISRMFQASFKDRMFQGCFKKVSGVFQGRLKSVSREFVDVSRVF